MTSEEFQNLLSQLCQEQESRYENEAIKYSGTFQRLPREIRNALLDMRRRGVVRCEIDSRGQERWTLILNGKSNSLVFVSG
jgi:hypothetical protein